MDVALHLQSDVVAFDLPGERNAKVTLDRTKGSIGERPRTRGSPAGQVVRQPGAFILGSAPRSPADPDGTVFQIHSAHYRQPGRPPPRRARRGRRYLRFQIAEVARQSRSKVTLAGVGYASPWPSVSWQAPSAVCRDPGSKATPIRGLGWNLAKRYVRLSPKGCCCEA